MFKKIILSLFLVTALVAQTKQSITVDHLWQMKRIGDVSLSADGKFLVFSAAAYDMEENSGNTDIYIVGSDGSGLKVLKGSEKSESNPVFSPDGKTIAYTVGGQIHTCDIDGNNDKQVTDLSTGASGVVWSEDGSKILFVSNVYAECPDDACNKQKDEERENSDVKAEIFTELMYRHWNDWRGPKISHLFLLDVASGDVTDLTLFSDSDVPPLALGSGNDYNFAPDGKTVTFAMNPDENLAWSTNNEVYTLDLNNVTKGEPTPTVKISDSDGNDNHPIYSPDGKYIAFKSMRRAGFEADQARILLFDREQNKIVKNLTQGCILSAEEMLWLPDSKYIYFTAEYQIYLSILRVNVETSEIEMVYKDHKNTNLMFSPDGTKLYFKQQRTNLPYEIFSLDIESKDLEQITEINKDVLAQLEMNDLETFWCEGASGDQIQSIMVKPPNFDPNKKYPMIFLIHGGPQGAWGDDFHYRWNQQMFAAPGYVVVAPNPRGSRGYGQEFTDEISGDWGGRAYEDLMNVYDYVLETYDFIDDNNTFAAGASYGGYMINWIAGHTDRFNALVSHAGVFNLESMYGTTEELWFPEWEMKGTPWQNRELYEKFSPHRYIHNCTTPVLVVHGAKDFRVPEEQAFQLFTSLQRVGAESKFLYFPDETHFVTKPKNAKLWWSTIYDWYDQFKAH